MESKLEKAIIRKCVLEGLYSVRQGGADCGISGFIYYKDTCRFFQRHKEEILEMVKESADELGDSPMEMVKSFKCLEGAEEEAIGQVLYGRATHEDCDMVKNGLVWFALETIAARHED